MDAQAAAVLDAAAAAMAGSVIRTGASVIGKRAGENLIVATTRFSYTLTVLLTAPLTFVVRPRGWLKKTLEILGSPAELVDQVLDATTVARLTAFQPLRLELGTNSLQLELRHGPLGQLGNALDCLVSIAQRARNAGRRLARGVA